MTHVAISMLCAIAAFAAHAFHVQIGFSGYSNRLAAELSAHPEMSPSSAWFGVGAEIGATNSYIGPSINYGRTHVYLLGDYSHNGGTGKYGVGLYWTYPTRELQIFSCGADGKRRGYELESARVPYGEVVAVPQFGPDDNERILNGLLTIRGDPYSPVVNDTISSIVVNGVTIPSGESAYLPFPICLYMAKIDGVRFFDVPGGGEIYTHDNGANYYTQTYPLGRYELGWTGGIRIFDGVGAPTNSVPTETLVFGDMISANEDKILYATNGMPVRSAIVNVTTNIQLQTWWDFNQSEWGSGPKAMINGEVVCDGHSTDHIIAHTVNANNLKVNELTGIGYVYFTMSQTPASGKSGGSCTMRCWDYNMGSTTEAYANTPAEHKAEVSAGLGVARFKITINIYAGTWKVEAL